MTISELQAKIKKLRKDRDRMQRRLDDAEEELLRLVIAEASDIDEESP
jgi:hypothetical protein